MIHVMASRHFSFAGFVVLIYDHLLTFGDEVQLVWSQPTSVVSVIFLVNRYLAPAVLAVDIYDKGGLTRNLSRDFCRLWVVIEGYLNLLLLAAIHVLMVMRVHALWGNQRKLRHVLVIAFTLYFVTSFAILTADKSVPPLGTIKFEHLLLHACWTTIPRYLWSVWIPALILECIMFALTAVRAWQYSKDGMQIPIVKALYRDGFQYFIGIMCIVYVVSIVGVVYRAPNT
ncbi:hypothetical protein FRC09_017588 [Ceratobasidium sp. 395]|nr:hypothetical protein FRC09_017588 [Ceratobasidium sp. 395]